MTTKNTQITSGHLLRWIDARLVDASVDPHDIDASAVVAELNTRLKFPGAHTAPTRSSGCYIEQWLQQAIPDDVFWPIVDRNPAPGRCVSVVVRDPHGRLLWSSPKPHQPTPTP